ncbi:MAG TPA: VOC family protein [Myxococcota bacterium]|nr:VOC family protein [Myxococcota bacterium]
MALHRLAAITVGVPKPDEVCAFYREFGLVETAPGRFATSDGGEQLSIVAAPRRNLLALELGVDDREDIERIASQLRSLGLEAKRGPQALETVEPTLCLNVRVRVEERVHQRGEPALALNAPGRTSRANARSPAVLAKERPRPRKLGHVVVGSPDAPATRRFFVEGLGFRVSDEAAAIGAVFLRCSTDHHNLLVQPAPLRFLHHTAWELGDIDEVGRAASELVATHPERHVWGLGRHGFGSNYFWYLRDPAGNFVEYYSDLDVIVDDEAWKAVASSGVHPLAAWGPEVPRSFLAPDDIVALARG